jgi:hypothetical protein
MCCAGSCRHLFVAFDRCLISFAGLSGGLLLRLQLGVPVKENGGVLQGFSCHNRRSGGFLPGLL